MRIRKEITIGCLIVLTYIIVYSSKPVLIELGNEVKYSLIPELGYLLIMIFIVIDLIAILFTLFIIYIEYFSKFKNRC